MLIVAGFQVPVIAGELVDDAGKAGAALFWQSDPIGLKLGTIWLTSFITIVADGVELHDSAFVTVKLYEPASNPEIVVVVPFPVVVDPPGFLVSVQVPVFGKPLNATLPVPVSQVGWIIVPMIGAAGLPGTVLITTSTDSPEVHPASLVII